MDFIVDLPESNLFTSIWVIVDRFTKMAHFIPLSIGTNAESLAKIFLDRVWKLHGLPDDIVSDRDSRFTAKFWSELLERLRIKRKMSTARHPETDGQTERVNQSLEQYLRIFCNYEQSDWSEMLPMAEYAYNNSVTSATGMSPFYANYGFHPRTNWPTQVVGRNLQSEVYTHWLEQTHEAVRDQLKRTRERMNRYFDERKLEGPKFQVGDKVLLNGKDLNTKRPSKKLDDKHYGPFVITKLVGNRAAQLELPSSMRIHPVFHIGLLEPYRTATLIDRPEPRPSPIEIDDTEEWKVESILGSEFRSVKGLRKVYYLTKWEGYPLSEATFEPMESFTGGAEHFLTMFHQQNPKAARDPNI
jgi:hypothetical protein